MSVNNNMIKMLAMNIKVWTIAVIVLTIVHFHISRTSMSDIDNDDALRDRTNEPNINTPRYKAILCFNLSFIYLLLKTYSW